MDVLAEIFCEVSIGTKKRAHLEDKLQKEFPDELLFLTVTYNNWPQLIKHKSCMQNTTMLTFMWENKKSVLNLHESKF